MARKIGEAFIEIRPETDRLGPDITRDAEAAGQRAGTSAGHRFASAMGTAIKAIGIGAAIGGLVLGAKAFTFLKQATADASDLNETLSKSQNIFPNTQGAIQAFGATAARSLGLSRQAALEGAASFGNFFNQIGIGEKQAATMSTRLIQLSADLGSFNNANPAEVMEAFLSATRGEYDALQRFIPTISAATIQTEALRLSHKKSAKNLTEADKAMALYSLAFRDAGKAQGDFARTAGGLANEQRTLTANFTDLRATIGTALLPVVTQLVHNLNVELIPALNELWAKHGPSVVAFLMRMTNNIGPLVNNLKGFDWKGFGEDISAAFSKLGPALDNLRSSDVGTSLSDNMKVLGTVMSFLADHADLLAKALPYLAAGFLLVKGAQAAANAVAVLSPAIRIAEVFATRALVASNRELAASLATSTAVTRAAAVAQAGETAAQNAGILARVRAVVSMIATRVAMVASRAATLAWAAAQWLLNAALTANPIGLVIVAIAALVAGIIYAYRHSETFRKIVQAAWQGIKIAAEAVVKWFVNVAWPFLQAVWNGIVAGVKFLWQGIVAYLNLIRAIWSAVWTWVSNFIEVRVAVIMAVIQRVREVVAIMRNAFEQARSAVVDRLNAVISFVTGIPGRILGALGNLGSLLYNAGRDIIQGMINGIRDMISKLVGAISSVLDRIPDAAKSILHLGSPSRLFREYGRDTMRGYNLGLGDAQPDLTATLGRAVTSVSKPATRPTGSGMGLVEALLRDLIEAVRDVGPEVGTQMAGAGQAALIHGRKF